MSKIIVERGQQEAVRREYPKPAYSRIVSVRAHVPEEVGATSFFYTPVLGNKIWLLHVDLWIINPTIDVMIDGLIYLMTGTTKPTTADDMIKGWDLIMKTYDGDVGILGWAGIREHFSWNMMKLYTTQQRRFGLVVRHLSGVTDWGALASFEISEG